MAAPALQIQFPTLDICERPRAEGKFLFVGDEKFFVKGTTYGAFPPNSRGHQFPETAEVARDFALMRAAGINAILTYTVPPLSLLDQALEHGIRVMPVVPWMEYVCFLEDSGVRKQILKQVRDGVASCRQHPAVMMYCVGKEIPPAIVRWHGRKKVEGFLHDLYHVAKEEDPDALVTYTSFPTTEYLELPFVDVCTFNVYLHQRPEFCKYLSRLQHLAGELPLVVTELGMCSFRHGENEQAAFLDWQIEEAMDHGLAGAVVFGWTDPFFQDGTLVTDWGFGLVDAERRPKPSYQMVQRRFTESVPFPSDRPWPRISVVVAAYNAASMLEACLESLRHIRYPDHEVIVINDGSTDDTEAVMKRFPFFKGITTANQGVSAARNTGLHEATGEIVAYIDSDAEADPDWLSYLAATYLEFDVVGVGGPNFVPETDNWVAKCVYRSPGGPTQVMLDDQFAEHIPGCNMSFRKAALDAIGGFDPIFTKAADDVDICWRLMDEGHRIGFSPSAVVWHHRRPSVKAYWRQQVGYGLSESILEKKFPNKFNPWGHTFWAGRIYAPYPAFRLFSRPTVYHGLWGSAPFQPMYASGGGFLSFLPRAMEFHLAMAALLVLGLFFPWALAVFGIGLLYEFFYCAACAAKANPDVLGDKKGPMTWRERLRSRALIGWLHLLEPIARDWGRLKGGLTPWRNVKPAESRISCISPWWQRLRLFRRLVRWSSPGGMAFESYRFLNLISRNVSGQGCAVGWNPDHESWDLKVRRGVLTEGMLGVVVEHQGGPKRLVRVSATVAPPKTILWLQGILGLAAVILSVTGFAGPALVLTAAFAILWLTIMLSADQLEIAILSAATAVADELLDNTSALKSVAAPASQASEVALAEE